MIDKYHESSRGRVFYRCSDVMETGRETLVFLHGLSADHTLFDKQIEHFYPNYM